MHGEVLHQLIRYLKCLRITCRDWNIKEQENNLNSSQIISQIHYIELDIAQQYFQQSVMKLHYNSEDFSIVTTRKLNSVVAATGAQLQLVAHKTKDDISKISVFHNLPLLETPEGPLFASSTIVRYLATTLKNELYGGDNLHHKALIDQWLDLNTTQFEAAARAVVAQQHGVKIDSGKLMEEVNKFLSVVEKHLAANKFLVGDSLSIADLALAASVSVVFSVMFGEGQRKKYQNTVAWYASVVAVHPECGPVQLPKEAHEAFKGGKKGKKEDTKKEGGKKEQKKAEKKVEDDDDLFGDDNTPAPAKPAPVKVQPKKQKKKAVAKSIVVFDVKVYEEEEDLQALFNKIKAIQIDGLVWNEQPKILPVAFKINKLQVGCVVEDEKVSLDDIYEKIQEWEEVQSTDTVSFQKL